MGVWIETSVLALIVTGRIVTPFVGVWIETMEPKFEGGDEIVTPFVGVWIETIFTAGVVQLNMSHPSWVCGLKLQSYALLLPSLSSHPSWVCGLKQS